ncbi:MAG: hypothetical protein BGO09_13865 [Bacteroidetes bacterium 47-18]|nr:MAG: hypothetical protein BGO09_13865 [Bacteroidetes bacterium 47-18]
MEAKKRIVYLGTKPIGAHCLEYILDRREELDVEVIAVGTRERKEFAGSNAVADLAARHHIPLLEHPDAIPECDIIYSVQYDKILKQQHIDKASRIAVNLHLAPLPDYRGCNQFSFAIFNGAEVFGVTIHEIDTGVDSGDILFEDRFPIPGDIWVKELFDISVDRGKQLFESTLKDIIAGSYVKVPQASLTGERGLHLYSRKDIGWLKRIDLEEPASKTARRIRATYMPGFEPPYVLVGGSKLFLKAAED